ncbi:MAG: hypothetical protein QOI19_2865 [Thermoleophilaceae bacterium]|nr:hypothetical protein [Thermoleophilaceae bacterium]
MVALRSGRVRASSPAARVAVSDTRVLRPARILAAPLPGAAGKLRYDGPVGVRAGQFVAADVGPQTPYGLLGRVVSARREGGDTVLSVAPARLTDAVPAGRIASGPAAAGAGVRTAAAARRRFASAFSCTSGAASVTGSLAVRLIPTFEFDWSLDGIERAEAIATIRGTAELEARVGAGATCTLSATVATWDAPPLRFAVGPIPVVLVPRTALELVGDATADAGIATGIRGEVIATAGLRYDGSVHTVGSFHHALSYTAPAKRVTASVGARVVPSISFLLYGQTGPRFDIAAGFQLDATEATSPWWTLTAPVELSAGFKAPLLDDFSIPSVVVFAKSFPLAEAEPDPGPPPPAPDDGAGRGESARGAERARISWDTAATDVDLHVWDDAGHHAWFRDPVGIPGAELSEDDRYGFGPEHFFDRTPGRRLTFGLCYFDDNGAGATHVAVRFIDPDGAVHESTRTLAHEGDHVLIGSSPAGSAFVPPEGWCRP